MAGVLDRIIDCGVVAVLRADSPTQLMDVSKALREGGVVAIEVTMTVPGALKVIEEASAKMKDTIIGKCQFRLIHPVPICSNSIECLLRRQPCCTQIGGLCEVDTAVFVDGHRVGNNDPSGCIHHDVG